MTASRSRRWFLARSTAPAVIAVTAAARSPRQAAALTTPKPLEAAPRPRILPRAQWAQGRAPKGPLAVEAPGDVRFLLIHHTQTPNTDEPDAIPGRLRGIYAHHTGRKGWPDVAYNFFVDPYGRIWEGRSGSLEQPVRGDATGGSQGYAQLCCFIGDHTRDAPTPAAVDAMTRLLAWLAARYTIDLTAGESIRFTSRGSNKWPRGTVVTTAPLAGHRDMSPTECPGDAAYPLVRGALLSGARQHVATSTPSPTTATSSAPTPRQRTTASIPSPSIGKAAAAGDRSPSPTARDAFWPAVGAGAIGAGAWVIYRRQRAGE